MNGIIAFVAFPYVALVLAVVGGLYRYFADRYSFTGLSSQLLENRGLFWGSVPWHYGIVPILLAHLPGLFFPALWGGVLSGPARLAVLEVAGLAFGFLSLTGIVILIMRRIASSRARTVTSAMDWVLLLLLCLQVVLGVYMAVSCRWGSLWYLHTAVPWLQSLAVFQPDTAPVLTLPVAVKLHLINAFVLILLFPFSRLVHIFTFPIRYLSRPWQVVIWNRRPVR